MHILIANRGEIARRVQRTAHRLGHRTVAAYADPDAQAPFVAEATTAVRLGPAELASSYLSIPALLDAADRTGADAVHPGYGFLSENADLARAVLGSGRTWIGPRADLIERMGSKIESRRLASEVDVPVIPGYDATQDVVSLLEAADRIGFPVLVKASAGGGGKGIRVAWAPEELEGAIEEAGQEAERTFGDGALIVERFVTEPRHIEVQVVGDRHGTLLDLGTRECSVQRRYQKMIEEAPAPRLPTELRTRLTSDARRLAEHLGYDSVGTVEFLVDDATGEHFFLEMNTRLQVEHTVTEEVTGLDLVELQLLAAEGRALPVTAEEVAETGHAIEVRIAAEDPTRGSQPRTGTITGLQLPAGARWDSGVEVGSEVTTHYDPMIAKLIVHGADRQAAHRRMLAALEELVIVGVGTDAGWLHQLLRHPDVVEARVTTRLVDGLDPPTRPDVAPIAAAAAHAWFSARRGRPRGQGPWSQLIDRRFTPHRPEPVVAVSADAQEHEVAIGDDPLVITPTAVIFDLERREVAVNVEGTTYTFAVPSRSERWRRGSGAERLDAGSLVAPFPATVAELHVAVGDAVTEGDRIVVLEAMKMLHTLTASGTGVVTEIVVAAGDQVASDEVLVRFAPSDEEGDGPPATGDENQPAGHGSSGPDRSGSSSPTPGQSPSSTAPTPQDR